MKNIKIMLLTAVTFLGLTSLVSAASLNGVYLELSTSAVGVEGDATVNEADSDITTGAVGKTAVTVSYGLGYMTARSNKLGLDIGYMWQPGEAKIKNNGANSVETSFEVSDTQEHLC